MILYGLFVITQKDDFLYAWYLAALISLVPAYYSFGVGLEIGYCLGCKITGEKYIPSKTWLLKVLRSRFKLSGTIKQKN